MGNLPPLDKQSIINAILAQLSEELEGYARSAKAAHAEATNEQSKAENKYDTRGLEASYLARGQSRQAAEVIEAVAHYQAMEPKAFRKGAPVDVGALVELEATVEKVLYFVGPRAGGTEVCVDGREVIVITSQSPLGQQLMGKKERAVLDLKLGPLLEKYRVISIT